MDAAIRSFNRISGDDPTIVRVPPRIAQNPIGMSRRDMARPERDAMRLTTGSSRAAAPTFCMKDEITAAVLARIGMVRRSLVLVGIGLGAGLALTLMTTRSMRGLLYGVEPSDPRTILVAALLLAGVASVAAWIPARRAAKVDPVEALRSD